MERRYNTSKLGPGIKIDDGTRRVVCDNLEAFGWKSEPTSNGRTYKYEDVEVAHVMGPQPEFIIRSSSKRALDRVSLELGLPLR